LVAFGTTVPAPWLGAALALTLAWSAPAAAQVGAPQRLVLSEGDTIAVTEVGRGPAVVIVPGLLGSAYSFRAVVDRLVQAGQRVLVVEPLGTGWSARPERADYTLEAQAARIGWAMHHTGVHRAVLLCHSVGASICYRTALQSPGRVEGIVAVNGGPDERAATSGLRFALRFAPLVKFFGGAGAIRSRLRDGLVRSSGDPAWVTEDVVDGYVEPFNGDMDRVLKSYRAIAAANETVLLGPRLGDIEVPVRLLVGAGSRTGAITQTEIDVLTRGLRRLHVDSVDGAGQYIQEEDPAAVVRAVLELRRTLAAAPGAGSR
jgi:pimeloyl-ACP methyl ester carboxylesterase